MTTVAPVNPRASVDAVFSEEWPDLVPAGHWHFYVHHGDDEGSPKRGILFGCPCGCGEMKSAAFEATRPGRPAWIWNGDTRAPTLTPSLNILQFDEAGNRIGEHWHGWLREGRFVSV